MANKQPYWFSLSYDANEALYKAKFKQKLGDREYKKDDFRKVIIDILKTQKVEQMFERVETTIVFLDPTDSTVFDKLDYWNKQFRLLGSEFKFTINAIWLNNTGGLLECHNQDETLNTNFNKLI